MKRILKHAQSGSYSAGKFISPRVIWQNMPESKIVQFHNMEHRGKTSVHALNYENFKLINW